MGRFGGTSLHRRVRPRPHLTIPASEFQGRRERLLRHAADNGWRPNNLAVFVPEFEVERVCAETDFERVESYPEWTTVSEWRKPPISSIEILTDYPRDIESLTLPVT